ncbi:hypothetical protein DID88_010160 [Monilinia fructigena]|uniref:Inosine/uridine-preferring nucleoside hydrolase domain-containing protein n=1 Tax=Monilinia fructigena TaxID=38457 RepID=A0A395IKP0_9HELO|nr:hypothetical protein DID88_010160 [Monilinia fructigena]
MSSNNSPAVPNGLGAEQIAIYQEIIRTVNARPKGFEIPHVVVITDIGKDYDDLTAMIILKELHRLGAIKLEGFIANLAPANKRAHFARKALDMLGLEDIPVGQGTRGEPPIPKENEDMYKPPAAYEFPKEIMGEEPYPAQPSGLDLLQELRANAVKGQYKLTFLLISSLQDITEFKRHLQPDPKSQLQPLKQITSRVILQGAYHLEFDPNTPPTCDPKYPLCPAVLKPEHLSIPGTRRSKPPLPIRSSKKWAATGQGLGVALYDIEKPQNLAFYAGACSTPPVHPGRDQEWFLTNRSTFYDNHPPNTPIGALPDPNTEAILDYCKVVVYDALAALGTSGDDILDALDVLKKPRYDEELVHNELHRVVGIDLELYRKPADEGIPSVNGQSPTSSASTNPEKMKHVIESLLMGALMDSGGKMVEN